MTIYIITLECWYMELDGCLKLLCRSGVLRHVNLVQSLMVGCFLSVASGGLVLDLLRCLQSAQSAFASIVPPGRHHLPQVFDALFRGLSLPGYAERTSLLLLPLSTYRD